MIQISIISSSVRTGRKSHRVALYLKNFIEGNKLADVIILDLAGYNFPLFEERLKFQKDPSNGALDFAEKISSSDGIIIVTPEYNGGYPASLKNATDLLTNEWRRKPVAISTVSDGNFGGSQVYTSLQFSLWKMGALTVPGLFPVAKVSISFNEEGEPADKEATDLRAGKFIDELLWCIMAKNGMEEKRKQG